MALLTIWAVGVRRYGRSRERGQDDGDIVLARPGAERGGSHDGSGRDRYNLDHADRYRVADPRQRSRYGRSRSRERGEARVTESARACSYILSEDVITENQSILAVNALAVNVLAVNVLAVNRPRSLYSVKSVFCTLNSIKNCLGHP